MPYIAFFIGIGICLLVIRYMPPHNRNLRKQIEERKKKYGRA